MSQAEPNNEKCSPSLQRVPRVGCFSGVRLGFILMWENDMFLLRVECWSTIDKTPRRLRTYTCNGLIKLLRSYNRNLSSGLADDIHQPHANHLRKIDIRVGNELRVDFAFVVDALQGFSDAGLIELLPLKFDGPHPEIQCHGHTFNNGDSHCGSNSRASSRQSAAKASDVKLSASKQACTTCVASPCAAYNLRVSCHQLSLTNAFHECLKSLWLSQNAAAKYFLKGEMRETPMTGFAF